MTYPPAPHKKRVPSSRKIDTGPVIAVHAAHIVPDTSTWLTRNEASDLLSCSQGTLLNYERRGVLHPQYVYRADGRGAEQRLVVYSPDELKKLATRMKRGSARDPGEVAARAFELFREGKQLEEVVVQLRSSPETIEYLHEKWLDMGGARFVISLVAKEALEAIVGPFESVTELVERIAKLKAA